MATSSHLNDQELLVTSRFVIDYDSCPIADCRSAKEKLGLATASLVELRAAKNCQMRLIETQRAEIDDLTIRLEDVLKEGVAEVAMKDGRIEELEATVARFYGEKAMIPASRYKVESDQGST